MKHVVNFSGGWCSFWAAHRVVQKFGPTDTVLLFADTLVEHRDLYIFNQCASNLLGVPITRISRELTPWQLFRQEGMIGNNKYPICSVMLKREILDQWMRENCMEMDAALYVGFDWTEEHRTRALRAALPHWRVEAPMQQEPIWDKCRMITEGSKLGLPNPELYEKGFTHNNCGGRCVRAGISHWVHLYHVDRKGFEEWEREEMETAAYLRGKGIEPLSILKDRRGGTSKNLYLADLAKEIRNGIRHEKDDWGGCGCGGAATFTENLP